MGNLRRWKWLVLVLLAALLLLTCGRVPPATETLTQPTPVPALATPAPTVVADAPGFMSERLAMVETQIVRRGVADAEVLRAVRNVPRHLFVLDEYLDQAYDDHPLPIGYGQTISQPYIVAVMTELLALDADDVVLEIGTGSGYQAAILAELVDEVYTLEIVPELCDQAQQRLHDMGYENVQVRCVDGYYGWDEHAPYDGIIVTCAPDHIPQPLVAQLADGGHMVIPVGPPGSYQVLWRIDRHGEEIVSERVMGVVFVPLTGTR